MMDRIGQQLGNYRLERLLGRGGFAAVYLGEHINLGTTAAIKILYTRVDEGDTNHFWPEVQQLSSLRHPQIVRIIDFGIDEQTPYIVMEYAPNGTLRTRHARGTQLPITTVVSYVKQIAEALQYAHDRKVVHRDVKPENMLLNEHNEILLSDFGVAQIAHTSRYQSTQDLSGTISYMAPEQIQGHPCPASDQYALGIVTYEWLTGTVPFNGSFHEIAVKHTLTPPVPLSERLPMLSPNLDKVIRMALAKQPEERFDSVSAFARALEQASQHLPSGQWLRSFSPPFPLHAPPPPPESLQPAVADPVPQAQKTHDTPDPDTNRFGSLPPPMPRGPFSLQTNNKAKTSRRRAILIGVTSVAALAALAAIGTGVYLTLPRQRRQPPLTYRGHLSTVEAVAWSPDGQRIASGAADSKVQVWNARDGSHIFTYRGHSHGVDAVVWSPDGKRIASGSGDWTVQVWNASDGSQAFTYQGHSHAVGTVAWSPNGKYLASGSDDKTVQVWNASNGNHILTYRGHTDKVNAVAWSPDGKYIASGSDDRTVQVWNASNGSNVYTYVGHTGIVYTVEWSPLDGKRVASGSGDWTVQVWNASDGSNPFTYRGHTDWVKAVAWSPDGKRIASGSGDLTAQVWNASDGSNVFTYKGHTGWVMAVAWSPDGTSIASGSDDRTVQVWHMDAG